MAGKCLPITRLYAAPVDTGCDLPILFRRADLFCLRARYKFAKTKWPIVLSADPASFPLAPLFLLKVPHAGC
jgi:hypothetical protein